MWLMLITLKLWIIEIKYENKKHFATKYGVKVTYYADAD